MKTFSLPHPLFRGWQTWRLDHQGRVSQEMQFIGSVSDRHYVRAESSAKVCVQTHASLSGASGVVDEGRLDLVGTVRVV
jgi:hypothetical protein